MASILLHHVTQTIRLEVDRMLRNVLAGLARLLEHFIEEVLRISVRNAVRWLDHVVMLDCTCDSLGSPRLFLLYRFFFTPRCHIMHGSRAFSL